MDALLNLLSSALSGCAYEHQIIILNSSSEREIKRLKILHKRNWVRWEIGKMFSSKKKRIIETHPIVMPH